MSKIALITGGSRGIGRSAALALARHGIDLVFTYLSKQAEAESLIAEVRDLGRKAVALHLDVGNSKQFPAFAEQLASALMREWQRKDFDFLVNNAGVGIYGSFAETTEEQFDQLVNVHFKGTFFLSQTLLPFIKNGGRILNISSGLARFSLPGYSAYASMKGAVETLTRYMALELGSRNISVNVIAPGAIETDFGGGAVRNNPQLKQAIAAQTALGRVGAAEDVGGVIASLISDDTRWINGQRIEVSGGIHL